MNEIIIVYIEGSSRGLDYNPMYKFTTYEEFVYRVELKKDVPNKNEIVAMGYRGDNLICVGQTFEEFVSQLKLIFE